MFQFTVAYDEKGFDYGELNYATEFIKWNWKSPLTMVIQTQYGHANPLYFSM